MKPYGIAKYLTDEQRERALSVEYRFVRLAGCTQLRTFGNRYICPLGVALGLNYSPDSRNVADRLMRAGRRHYAIAVTASRFILDVDSGVITPETLPAALGATP